jgi:hypothetical protein
LLDRHRGPDRGLVFLRLRLDLVDAGLQEPEESVRSPSKPRNGSAFVSR